MAKSIPPALTGHILPINWDVRQVWAMDAKVTERALADFEYLLDLPLWSSRPNQGMLFDISPREVLTAPERSPHQTARVHNANIAHPIDLLRHEGREWVLDGVHRIAKLLLMGATTVKVRIHDESVIPRITVPAGPPAPIPSSCELHPLTPADEPSLHRMFTCPDVRRFLGGPVDPSLAAKRSKEWIERSSSEPIWAVRRSHDQALLGYVILDPHHGGEDVEISYALLPEHWGAGHATEALKQALHRAATDHGLHEVVAETQAKNHSSIRLLERLGFHEEQRLIRFGEEQVIFRGRTS